MNGTITRQAAYDTLTEYYHHHTDVQHAALWEALGRVPDALIRCKDCKKNPQWEWVGCPMTGKDTRKSDDFCSYAERREE